IAPDAEWPSGSTYAPTEHANAAAATNQPIAVGDAPGVTRAAPITTSVAATIDARSIRDRRVIGEPTWVRRRDASGHARPGRGSPVHATVRRARRSPRCDARRDAVRVAGFARPGPRTGRRTGAARRAPAKCPRPRWKSRTAPGSRRRTTRWGR